jgi:hypothetical protein
VPRSCLLLLGSCGSPPKPPTVDESQKRPATPRSAVDLQVCKSELQNSRIVVSETTRLAEHAQCDRDTPCLAAADRSLPSPRSDMSNVIHTVHFAFGSVEVKVPETQAAR